MLKSLLKVLLTGLLTISGLSAGVLTGDMVNVTHYFPNLTSVYDDLGTQSIPTGHYVYQNGVYTVDVFDDYVDMTFVCPNCSWGAIDTFNGPVIHRLSSAAFTGVTIDATTAYSGFNAGRLSFNSSNIYVDLQGLSINGFIRLNLQGETAPPPAPEPATMSMGGIALAGLVLLARRRAGFGAAGK